MLSEDNDSIYGITKRQFGQRSGKRSGKSQHYYYAWEDDPTFQAFKGTVDGLASKNNMTSPGLRFLYKLWYESSSFRNHWQARPTKKTANLITFILSERLVSDDRAELMVVAWLGKHYPTLTSDAIEHFLEDLYYPEWNRLEAIRNMKRSRTNRARREKRRMKKGRPFQTEETALRNRILTELKNRPSTASILACLLDAQRKTVSAQLIRMAAAGELKKLCRGQYALSHCIEA